MLRGTSRSLLSAAAIVAALSGCREVNIFPTRRPDASATSTTATGSSTPSSTSGPGSGGAGGQPDIGQTGSSVGPGSGGAGGGAPFTQCPAPNDSAVGTNALIRIQSEEPIDLTTVASTTLNVFASGVPIPGSTDGLAHSLIFTPDAPLPANASIEIVLSPLVLDDLGHPLTDTFGNTWWFTTGPGPADGEGFVFDPPVSPPLGDHAPRFGLAMDGEHPVLAWSAAAGLVISQYDATTFANPLHVADGVFAEGLTFALGGERAHMAWASFNGPTTINYATADLPFTSATGAPVALSPYSNGASLAADDDDHVAMASEIDSFELPASGVQYITSSNGGSTWSAPVPLDLQARCIDVAYVDGYLVLVWVDGNIGDQSLLAASSPDNGATLSPSIALISDRLELGCPSIADNGSGAAVVLFADGYPTEARSANVVTYAPATNTAGPLLELAAPDEAQAVDGLNLATSPATGKVVVARSRGHSFQSDWVTELYTSDDGGGTFGAPTAVDVLEADEGSPALGYAASGDVHLAWLRDDFTLEWSRGRRKRPCE